MSDPKDDFQACYGKDEGGNSEIIVKGTAHESDGSTTSLLRAEPQGINPRILLLELHVKPYGGPIVPHIAFDRHIQYEERAEKGEFTEVHIETRAGGFTLKAQEVCRA